MFLHLEFAFLFGCVLTPVGAKSTFFFLLLKHFPLCLAPWCPETLVMSSSPAVLIVNLEISFPGTVDSRSPEREVLGGNRSTVTATLHQNRVSQQLCILFYKKQKKGTHEQLKRKTKIDS